MRDQTKQLSDTLKTYLKENIRNEFLEVILKIFHTPHLFLKTYLFFFVAISSGLAAYMVIQSFISYFAYEVITTSRTVFETPTMFPKVTVCNINPFTTEYAYNFLKEDPVAETIFDQNRTLSYRESVNLINDVTFRALGLINLKNFSDQDRARLGHSFDDILLSCYYGGAKCNSSYFSWKFDPFYGNCYVFNSGERIALQKSSVAGPLYGLKMKFFVNFNEKLNVFNANDGSRGAYIRIDNCSYVNYYPGGGLQIQPGSHTNIAVGRAFKYIMPKPYSNCDIDSDSTQQFDSDLYESITQSSYEYTQQLCLEQCWQKLLFRECNCSDLFSPIYYADKCTDSNQNICLYKTLFNTYLANNYIQEKCMPLCPLECRKTEFTTSITSSRLIGDLYAKYIQENKNLSADFGGKTVDANLAKESIVSLNIFYDSLSYTLSTESAKLDVVSMLASIGGNLGLFLGISMFSVCELVDILFEMCILRKKISKGIT